MSLCRYESAVTCYGVGTHDICPPDCIGPVDLSKDVMRHGAYPTTRDTKPKPAAPAREEEKPVAQGVKGTGNPIGTCDRCGKDGRKLGTSKHAPGKRLCVSCSVRAYKLSLKGLALDDAEKDRGARKPTKPASAPEPVKASKVKAAAPIARQEPVQEASGPVTAAPGAAAVLVLTIHTIAALWRVIWRSPRAWTACRWRRG